MNTFVTVILVAGGTRMWMSSSTSKQFLQLKVTPVAVHCLEALSNIPWVREVIIACYTIYCDLFPKRKNLIFAHNEECRQGYVWNTLEHVSASADLICIHDAARPLLTEEDTLSVIKKANTYGAATLAVQVKNTIKAVNTEGIVQETLDRTTLWEVQTPQVVVVLKHQTHNIRRLGCYPSTIRK